MLASAAVPGIMNPVVLMQKLPDGQIVPWNWGSKFKDGSLRYARHIFCGLDVDAVYEESTFLFRRSIFTSMVCSVSYIPSCVYFILDSVTHPVVSQVNPHVHLFFFASRGSAGKPVAHRKGKGVILYSRLFLLIIA